MYSIGALSRHTGVKVPTIRYYEQTGLLAPPDRTEGNQRRYTKDSLDRLAFIKHARDLGFPIQSILALIELQDHPDRGCQEATDIAISQLSDVRAKMSRLQSLEHELVRLSNLCAGDSDAEHCHVLASLADHSLCETDHR